jgi:hypothetical protein
MLHHRRLGWPPPRLELAANACRGQGATTTKRTSVTAPFFSALSTGARWRGQFGKVLRFHLENGKAPTLTTGGTRSMARVGNVNGKSSDERCGMGGDERFGKSSDGRSGMGSDGRSGMGSDVRSGRGSDGRSGRVSDERFVEV